MGLHPVTTRIYGDYPIPDGDGILALDAIVHGVYGDAAAGYLEVVLARNTVIVAGVDRQRAAAIDGQVVLAKDRCVGLIRFRVLQDVVIPIAHGVFGTIRQSDHRLFRM